MAIRPLVTLPNVHLGTYIQGCPKSDARCITSRRMASSLSCLPFRADHNHYTIGNNRIRSTTRTLHNNYHYITLNINNHSYISAAHLGTVRPEMRKLAAYSQTRACFTNSGRQNPLVRSVAIQCDNCGNGVVGRRGYATKHDKYLSSNDSSTGGDQQQKRGSPTFKDSIFFKRNKQQDSAATTSNNGRQNEISVSVDTDIPAASADDDNSSGSNQQQQQDKTRNRNNSTFVHRNDQITRQNSGQIRQSQSDQTATDADQLTETAEDLIFDMFNNGNDGIKIKEFLSSLSTAGLHYDTDPRLNEFKKNLKALRRDEGPMSKKDFKAAIKPNIVLISRAMRGDFVIPDWTRFTKTLEEFYWRCRINKNGKVANYIPQLAKYNPDYWGVSICSIDGQRYHVGDVDVPFTIQSSGKPINYAIALNELGSTITHKYVGQEPSGRLFNDLSLKIFDESGHPKPHNPMVNSGAIVTCSLLMKLIKPDMRSSEKFDWVCDFYKSMAGGEYIGFNNATFLSEREAADRNYAIGFYMRENKCFPDDTNLQQVMDFYFQLCSLEVNCKTVSMIAATLANGGICPVTEKKVIDSRAVRNVLSLMHSCGMYDYSGQFAFYVGLPAKSGVSGCTLVVIPNVGGLGLFSPPLDTYGNSVRSLQFCHELVDQFNFHQYDNLRHVPHKSDPRRKKYETLGLNIICLLFAAAKGDMSAIRRYYMSGMDMSLCDYDHRTALHAAAAEGNLDIVEFLLQVANVNHEPKDRWGRRPIDDASYCGHLNVVDFLKAWPQIKDQGASR